MLTDLLRASCCLGVNIIRSSKQRYHTKGDFNPPQTAEERVFERRLGRKIWSRLVIEINSFLLLNFYGARESQINFL